MLDQFRAQKIEWNRANNQIYDRVEANSGDSNGRTLFVQILNGGMVEDLTGAVLSLAWNKGTVQGLEAFDEVDAKKGQFRLFYPTGMLVNPGVLQASLVLVDVTGRIESKPFDIIVRKGTVDDEAVESDNKFTALTTALVKVSQVQAEFDGLYADKSQMMDTLHDDKKADMEALEQDYANRANTLETAYAPRLTGVEGEIDVARGEAQTLGERLDSEKAEVSAQLAQTETEINQITSNMSTTFEADNCIEIAFELSSNFITVYNKPLKMFIYPDGRIRITGRVRLTNKTDIANNGIATMKQPQLIANGRQYQTSQFEIVRDATVDVEEMIVRMNAFHYWNPENPAVYRPATLALERIVEADENVKYKLALHQKDYDSMLVNAELYIENEAYWEYFDQSSKIYKQTYQKSSSLSDTDFNFIYAPDVHSSLADTRHEVGNKYINKVKSICDMPVITTGDIVQNYEKPIVINGIKKIVNMLGTNFLFAKGNHDDNSLYSKSTNHVITESELKELIFGKMKPNGLKITFGDGMYYYVDDEKRKIRLVFINTHENDYTVTNGFIKEDTGVKGYINQKQLEFVAYDALNFEQKGADYTNWHVIFFAHYPLHFAGTKAYGGETTENGEQMWEIIKAFKNGTSITIPPVTRSNPAHDLSGLTVDFTQQGPMSVVGFFYGHYHNDQMQIKDGITLVSSECFSAADYNVDWEQVARHVFSYDEFAFDVVTINKSSRKVTLKRIGNDSLGDREFTY